MTKLSHSFSSIKLYENCPLRYYHQRVIKSVVDKGGEASQYGERIHKFLELRLAEDQDLPQEAAHYEKLVQSVETIAAKGELHIECEMTLNQDLKPTGWWDQDAWLRSKLDVLIECGNTAYVLDWKTGRRRPDFSQLELFALQVFAHCPEVDEVSSTFIWLKDMAMDKETYTRKQSAAMWQGMLARIRRIEQSLEKENWPAKPSGLCKFCPCRHLCEYAL